MISEDWLLKQLHIAYLEARKGKRGTNDEATFELNAWVNLQQLCDDILERRYKPNRGIAFIIKTPVIREIFAAPFRDRIIHHFLYNMSYDWWDRRLIDDSYSCRPGKGTLYGIRRLAKFMESASENYTKRAYVLKLDIQGYFMSLAREKLFERITWGLERQYAERSDMRELLSYLWGEVIFDDPCAGVLRRGTMLDWRRLPKSKSLFCQPPGKGIVIGNLSSQLLSNLTLDLLDRYIKYDLKYKYYGRYVDDFFIIVPEEELPRLKADVKKIDRFLTDLGLTLHPHKRYLQEIHKGVGFLGAVVYPGRIVPSKRMKNNFYKAVKEVQMGYRGPETVASYLGHLKHMNGERLIKEVFESVGWEYRM